MANPQLRELLDRGSRRLDLPFDNAEPIDITERFFEDCSSGVYFGLLWTNVLLTEPDRVLFKEHPVFSCLAHGFFHAVMLVKCVIQNASVYEEIIFSLQEDFNPHLPFPCSSQYSLHEVLQFMKEVELDLVSKAEKPDHASLKAVLLSLSSRIAFLRLFLVTITHLVPPRRTECVDSDPLQMPPLDAIGFTYYFGCIFRFYGEVLGRWHMTSIEKTRELMRDTLKKGSFSFTLCLFFYY
ncbi:hypothetical protein ANCDUO_00462 [Ancylostoma duodenale]|uniref:Uncharacterized protein n=1 Tax=Ancylostoma duodenale TaxID=51022 RepID=A0A0C2H5R2_9BILA|nr:hypothetical protein ANCDUO_00462 [Ancylostoma duodenale]